jgi:hypothetical protein
MLQLLAVMVVAVDRVEQLTVTADQMEVERDSTVQMVVVVVMVVVELFLT